MGGGFMAGRTRERSFHPRAPAPAFSRRTAAFTHALGARIEFVAYIEALLQQHRKRSARGYRTPTRFETNINQLLARKPVAY
jgi:hypothetical protein